jgi:DNA-binding HxlR family transcriptional regulator
VPRHGEKTALICALRAVDRRVMEDAGGDPGLVALAQEMALFGNDREAPARAVMAMLGDRWTTLILLVLGQGEMRYADLKRTVARLSFEKAISQRILTLKLRALERDGFVLRTVTTDVPPRASYRLSPSGVALEAHARAMITWINGLSAEIRNAREHYDRCDVS